MKEATTTRRFRVPGLIRRVRYSLGFRLPEPYREWVRHDLTDAGWRARMLGRHLTVMAPICAVMTLLPGDWWIRVMVIGLALAGSVLTVLVSAVDIRGARLRQHRLPAPDDRGRGRLSR